MANSTPLVSIVIPVYNGSAYLAKAIDSALRQTYSNIEIIVVNDGSTDDGATAKVARSYGDSIRYYEKENGGVSSALNMGISLMNGEYFSWLSHDDEYHPGKIASQIETLSRIAIPRCIALCGTEFIGVNSDVLKKQWKMPKEGLYQPKEALSEMLHAAFSGIALLIPKKAFVECGTFNESLRYLQDAEMWQRIFLGGYMLVVENTNQARSRLHGAQQTNLHRDRFKAEYQRTVFPYCEKLLQAGYVNVVQETWLKLNKNQMPKEVKRIRELLIKNGVFAHGLAVKGVVYIGYGIVRPFIRNLYYRLLFGIKVKENG